MGKHLLQFRRHHHLELSCKSITHKTLFTKNKTKANNPANGLFSIHCESLHLVYQGFSSLQVNYLMLFGQFLLCVKCGCSIHFFFYSSILLSYMPDRCLMSWLLTWFSLFFSLSLLIIRSLQFFPAFLFWQCILLSLLQVFMSLMTLL